MEKKHLAEFYVILGRFYTTELQKIQIIKFETIIYTAVLK